MATTEKWEYAEFIWSGGMGSSRAVMFTDGSSITKVADGWAPRMQILRQLGNDGWELVGYTTGGDGKDSHMMYVFKRPRGQAQVQQQSPPIALPRANEARSLSTPADPSDSQRVIAYDRVNLYERADKTSRARAILAKGTFVTVLEMQTASGWVHIALEDGGDGWVSAIELGRPTIM